MTSSGIGRDPQYPTFHLHYDDEDIYVDFVRDGLRGNGAARRGNSRWRRLTEERTSRAKSVFHFDVQKSVAKSTHAGIPWLRFIRQRLGSRVHFWPIDGWDILAGRSAIAEVYPALWSRTFKREGRTAVTRLHTRLALYFRDILSAPSDVCSRSDLGKQWRSCGATPE
jgi:hypothetical protein